jgi:hypothetical protein
VNVARAALIVIVVTAAAVACLLLVRRRAPEGGYFSDGDRAAGVFGVLATGLSILLGLLIVLSFESYDTAKTGAETEALTVAQQVETAHLLPAAATPELVGELICYARYVVGVEWPEMRDGSRSNGLNPWGAALFTSVHTLEPTSVVEETAYGKWLDQTSTREEARRDRIHGASGLIPAPLWIVVLVAAGIIFLFMLFFADSGERAASQALLIGSVVAVVTAMLLLLAYFDEPYRDGVGSLDPTAMERALQIIDLELDVSDITPVIACDDAGLPI